MIMLLLVVLILIPVITTTDGAESFLRAFSDPKDVELKTSSCATTAQSCEPPDIDLIARGIFEIERWRGSMSHRILLPWNLRGDMFGRWSIRWHPE